MVRAVIRQALKEGSTEIHIEPVANCVRMTHLANRRVRNMTLVPRSLQIPLTKLLRTLAGLEPSGDGFSQEGEMWVRLRDQKYHLILFTTPAEFGECITIRLPA